MNLNFEEEIKKQKRKKIVKECLVWLVEILFVILVAYLFIHFCARRTSTIGSAMEPTLYNGEEVLINTKAYLFFSPDREDIIAFYDGESSADEEEPLITFRRVIGLPGEKIQIVDGKIQINGQVLDEKYTYQPIVSAGIAEQEITLGDDEYFVLCDSRIDSDDSRNASFGNVKESRIIGRVLFKLRPFLRVTGPDDSVQATATPAP